MKQILFLLPLFILPAAFAADWRTDADARIEQYRKESVNISVTINGKPAAGIAVEIKMLRHEFLFGCNIFKLNSNETPQQNEEYGKQFADIFNFATLPFYWANYEREKDKPSYASSEKIAAWCKKNGIRPKGHPLVWNTSDPKWIADMTQDELYQRLVHRAEIVPNHFTGTIDTWDVINEVTAWERQKKRSPLLTQLGIAKDRVQLTKDCFTAARKANPKATLLINDYITDKSYSDLIEKLTENGKPIYDAIGIQSHMHGGVWGDDRIKEVCERFAKFDVPIHFTEITIISTSQERDWQKPPDNDLLTGTDSAGEQKQAEEVERFYTMLFSYPSVAAMTWWDFSDQGAWKKAPAGLLRKDMSPKPAYDVLKKLIKEKWATNVTVKTDANGKAALRAYRGEYQITVTLPDGTKKKLTATVQKGENNIKID
ncbi:MAG: endo-1,4-beta-xylanase [Planctomycetaceae bacterium]|nr:endo-1,4-beta-xylanase [Planctomycetaceae bacterium]